ncbi:MAG: transposase [Pseudomonadota bacterium]
MAIAFRPRDLVVRQRPQAINALRGHLTEFGFVAPWGLFHAARLESFVADPSSGLPEAGRTALGVSTLSLRALEERICVLDREIRRQVRENATAKRLRTIPGIGPITAAALVALSPPAETFGRGRDFATLVGGSHPASTQAAAKRGWGARRRWASARCAGSSSSAQVPL